MWSTSFTRSPATNGPTEDMSDSFGESAPRHLLLSEPASFRVLTASNGTQSRNVDFDTVLQKFNEEDVVLRGAVVYRLLNDHKKLWRSVDSMMGSWEFYVEQMTRHPFSHETFCFDRVFKTGQFDLRICPHGVVHSPRLCEKKDRPMIRYGTDVSSYCTCRHEECRKFEVNGKMSVGNGTCVVQLEFPTTREERSLMASAVMPVSWYLPQYCTTRFATKDPLALNLHPVDARPSRRNVVVFCDVVHRCRSRLSVKRRDPLPVSTHFSRELWQRYGETNRKKKKLAHCDRGGKTSRKSATEDGVSSTTFEDFSSPSADNPTVDCYRGSVEVWTPVVDVESFPQTQYSVGIGNCHANVVRTAADAREVSELSGSLFNMITLRPKFHWNNVSLLNVVQYLSQPTARRRVHRMHTDCKDTKPSSHATYKFVAFPQVARGVVGGTDVNARATHSAVLWPDDRYKYHGYHPQTGTDVYFRFPLFGSGQCYPFVLETGIVYEGDPYLFLIARNTWMYETGNGPPVNVELASEQIKWPERARRSPCENCHEREFGMYAGYSRNRRAIASYAALPAHKKNESVGLERTAILTELYSGAPLRLLVELNRYSRYFSHSSIEALHRVMNENFRTRLREGCAVTFVGYHNEVWSRPEDYSSLSLFSTVPQDSSPPDSGSAEEDGTQRKRILFAWRGEDSSDLPIHEVFACALKYRDPITVLFQKKDDEEVSESAVVHWYAGVLEVAKNLFADC